MHRPHPDPGMAHSLPSPVVDTGSLLATGNEVDSLRVLHVYRTYFPDPQGGLQEAIRQICLSTRDRGVVPRVFTLSPDPVPAVIHREEADVYRFCQHVEIASSGFSLTALSGFRRLVNWADVVHYHFPWPFADLLHWAGGVTKPTLVTYHSDIVRQQGLLRLYRPLMHRFLRSANRIVATSPAYAESSAVLRHYREKTLVIPLGLDEASYPPVSTEALKRVRAVFGDDFFLFVGVLRYYKGLHDLLAAVRGTSLRVVIAGTGPEEGRLKALARAYGGENVCFAGYVAEHEKTALIAASRGLVFPSNARSEAFGMTLLEGAMMARPLICSELGTGTTYVNRHNETGLVVPPADPIALREAMLKLVADDELTLRLGRDARARFERLFNGRSMGEQYAQLYRELVAN